MKNIPIAFYLLFWKKLSSTYSFQKVGHFTYPHFLSIITIKIFISKLTYFDIEKNIIPSVPWVFVVFWSLQVHCWASAPVWRPRSHPAFPDCLCLQSRTLLGAMWSAVKDISHSWWCHDMKTLYTLLVLWEGNPLGTSGFPSHKGPILGSFDVGLNKLLNIQQSLW